VYLQVTEPGRLTRTAITGEDPIGGLDEQAFAQLVHRYLRKAMAVAMEYCDSLDDAEDVVQETFRRVAEGLPGFDSARPFDPWFFTILRNTARNWAKSRRVRAHDDLSPDHESDRPGPGEDADRRELRQQLSKAISHLPAMQQTCFRLCLVEGLSSREAADALDLAESTVRVHVMRARQALQVELAGWRDDWEES
jgi:RNA polymerase sigma-70 factor (ECF subfamily)